MREITLIVDELRGEFLVEDNQELRAGAFDYLLENFGEVQEIACARPRVVIEPKISLAEMDKGETGVRVAGFYHNSLTEGPGRRSSVLFQFCPLKCKGCYVPELHGKESGVIVSAKQLAELLLDPKFERDGVTILGGEPFAQPEGMSALIKALRKKGCRHIVCYSGYTVEVLREKAADQPAIGEILDEIDILIDGPFIEAQAHRAGLWTGSGNQRVIDLVATRKSGRTILYRSRELSETDKRTNGNKNV